MSMEYKIVTSNIFFSHLSEETKLNQFASKVLNIITIHLNNEVKIKRKRAEFKKRKTRTSSQPKAFSAATTWVYSRKMDRSVSARYIKN